MHTASFQRKEGKDSLKTAGVTPIKPTLVVANQPRKKSDNAAKTSSKGVN